MDQTAAYTVVDINVAGGVISPAATLSLITPAAGHYQQGVIAAGPIAYWQLNETSGTSAFDYVGGYDSTYAEASR